MEPVRSIMRLEAVFMLVALLALYWRSHASWLAFVVFLLAPDIAMFAYLRDTRIGAWTYNAFHTFTAPLICLGFSLVFPWLLPIAIVWAAHIALDRAFGYGLKYGDSFQHTHLGVLGRKDR